ncbi:hypothetical protein CMUS01_15358 [Colletotrichum musicola]|uniref:Uncharacterized protein n=1 Tax=Colletotrichum musicola TaxID=2175873 RepID=A0A8H6IXQ5_9PEZI|nr:hypothetical protein CMUS01_15358 [Colletotrichum musicola]
MPEEAKPAMDQNSICRHSAAFQPLLIGRQLAVLLRARLWARGVPIVISTFGGIYHSHLEAATAPPPPSSFHQ